MLHRNKGIAMKLQELMGKHMRLRGELARAYEAGGSNTNHLNRLGDEIALTERALARLQCEDEEADVVLPAMHLQHQQTAGISSTNR